MRIRFNGLILMMMIRALAFGERAVDWEVIKAEDSQVIFEEQKVVIKAKEESFASLTRSVPKHELIHASCEIFPTYSRNHANGILLFWDADNWIRYSVVRLDVSDYGGWFAHKGGGYYLVNRMTEGRYAEEVLGTCAGAQPHRLGIELAEDGVRFMVMPSKEKWINYKLEHRALGVQAGPPRDVFFGKTGIATNYPKESADSRFAFRQAKPGPEVVSELSRIVLAETAPGRRKLSALEHKELEQPGIDHLGIAEVSGARDPTFASVSQYFPDMKFYREVIGLKDHPQDIGVGFDGSLEFKDRIVSSYWMDPAPDTGFFTANSQRLGRDIRVTNRRMLDGHWPAVVCEFQGDGMKFIQTVFGCSKDFSLTEDLYGYCALEVVNETDETRTIDLRYSVAPDRLKWNLVVPARSRETVFLKAAYDAKQEKADKLTRKQYQTALRSARRYWEGLFKQCIQLELPEKRVADAFKVWLAYTFINIDKRGDRYFICDGSGFYNEIYGYSACIYIRALLRLGYFEDARVYLLNQLQFVRDDGLFLLNFGATDTGSYLRAFADYYRYTRDRKTIAEVLPYVKRMAGWITKQRASSKTDSPITSGLIHVRPYADHPEATYAYLTDTYLCKGLDEAAFLMRAVEDPAAQQIEKEAKCYRQDIYRSMDHAIVERYGMKLLPMIPETDGQFKKNNDHADDYFGSNSSMLLEIGFLEPRGRYADLIVDLLEKRGGKSLGCLAWRRGIDHAYLYGYLLNCLQRNRPREAVLGLYGWMAYGMTRNTYAGAEVTYHRLGDDCATLPHTFSSCEQMRLLLDMLVRPEGDDLYLAQAVPDAWLAPGQKVAVENAPTPFGKVRYRMTSTASGLSAEIDLPDEARSVNVFFGLRPPGRKIREITVNKKPAEVRDGLVTIQSSPQKIRPPQKIRLQVKWE